MKETLLENRHWSKNAISDDSYRQKFTYLPKIISEWMGDVGGFEGKDVLDFGCGEATTALGVALQYSPNRVVGIDIMPDVDLCAQYAERQLGLLSFPDNFKLYRVEPGYLHGNDEKFDIIYSWSVFEHVEQAILSSTLELLRAALKPKGRLFIQIAPLFYSPDGSHLMFKIAEPWGHLKNQHSIYIDKLRRACSSSEEFNSLRCMYDTLNKITASQLVDHVEEAGFKVLRKHSTKVSIEPSQQLLEIYNRNVLENNQIVLLLEGK